MKYELLNDYILGDSEYGDPVDDIHASDCSELWTLHEEEEKQIHSGSSSHYIVRHPRSRRAYHHWQLWETANHAGWIHGYIHGCLTSTHYI